MLLYGLGMLPCWKKWEKSLAPYTEIVPNTEMYDHFDKITYLLNVLSFNHRKSTNIATYIRVLLNLFSQQTRPRFQFQ